MTKYRRYFLAVNPLFLISFASFGQAVSNVNARIDNQNLNIVHIFYNLQGKVGEKFRIELFKIAQKLTGILTVFPDSRLHFSIFPYKLDYCTDIYIFFFGKESR